MQLSIGKNLWSFETTNSRLDLRVPFVRIGKFEDGEGGYEIKFQIDISTYIGYTTYDYGNSFTFMILGFGIDYWWTNCLGAVEEDDDDI